MRHTFWPDGSREEHAAEIDAHLAGGGGSALPMSVWVCEVGPGRLAGLLELSVRDYAEGCSGPTPHVEGWYVDAHHRRRGIGRALLRAAESWAREHGYRELASDTGLENRVSERAHLALGFTEVERAIHFRKAL